MELYVGDAKTVLDRLPARIAHTCVTSPPYWGLRDYDIDGQLGGERSPDDYVANLVDVLRGVRRVLRDDGTVWLNLGDSYAKRAHRDPNSVYFTGLKPGDVCGIPWAVAMALRADGWHLRNDVIWHKEKVMPASVKDRLTVCHEYVFLLAKQRRYAYDVDAIREPHAESTLKRIKYGLKHRHSPDAGVAIPPVDTERMGTRFAHPLGRNRRTVWRVSPTSYKGAHFAVYPPKLIEPCVLAGCPEGGVVLDPFFGSGTTGLVAREHGRRCIGIELSPEFAELARARLLGQQPCPSN